MNDTMMKPDSGWLWNESPSFYGGDTLHAWKQSKVAKTLAEAGLDAMILTKSEAVRYVTDFYVKGYRPFMDPEYFAIVFPNGSVCVGYSSGSDTYRIAVRSDIEDARKVGGLESWAKTIDEMLRDHGVRSGRVGVDLLNFTVERDLRTLCQDIEFVDASEVWIDLTVVKHPIEIDHIREAISIAEMGVYRAMECVRPGIRERDVACEAEYAMRREGSEMTPFLSNIASGRNACVFERIATDKRIRYGEMVIIDVGSVFKGYTGDLGRTVCVGKPSDLQRRIYQTNFEALHAAIDAVRPGATCADVDAAARNTIRSNGLGQYEHKFTTGHQLGWGLHGEPLVNKGVDYVLQPGMVMCLEPRVTVFDDWSVGGAHLEDAVLVTETGREVLSHIAYDNDLLAL